MQSYGILLFRMSFPEIDRFLDLVIRLQAKILKL
jgi:hypothetical protein